MRIRGDRGAVSMSVVAPIVAAVIGGLAAIIAAIGFVNLAPSAPSTPRSGQVVSDQSNPALEYGSR